MFRTMMAFMALACFSFVTMPVASAMPPAHQVEVAPMVVQMHAVATVQLIVSAPVAERRTMLATAVRAFDRFDRHRRAA